MPWLHYLCLFFAGAFFTNALPHFVSGVMGRSFQTPFAKPRGRGLSSATVNVLWGGFNLLIAYLLFEHQGYFDLHNAADALAAGLGVLLTAVICARLFGRFHGGNTPTGI